MEALNNIVRDEGNCFHPIGYYGSGNSISYVGSSIHVYVFCFKETT